MLKAYDHSNNLSNCEDESYWVDGQTNLSLNWVKMPHFFHLVQWLDLCRLRMQTAQIFISEQKSGPGLV